MFKSLGGELDSHKSVRKRVKTPEFTEIYKERARNVLARGARKFYNIKDLMLVLEKSNYKMFYNQYL